MPPSTLATSPYTATKRVQPEPPIMDKHDTESKCAATSSVSHYSSSKNVPDDTTMNQSTMEGAGSTVEVAADTTTNLLSMVPETSRNVVSLLDMPLEILFMIYDYATCRNHLMDPDYRISLKKMGSPDYDLVISQPALLMVTKPLRAALSYRFYSRCSFHARIESRALTMSAASGLRIQRIDNKLPYPLKLSTISLTVSIRTLSSTWGFSPSILVELGKRLFVDYQTMDLSSDNEIRLIDLRWRLVWVGNAFSLSYQRDVLDQDLQLLLDEIHKLAAESASLGRHTLQEFGSWLEAWLEETDDYREPTYKIKTALRCLP